MRPIDGDALIDFLDVGHLRPPTEICFSELMVKNIVEMMPTVDAIPVSWLEDLHKTAQSEEADRMIDEIISLWEARKFGGDELSPEGCKYRYGDDAEHVRHGKWEMKHDPFGFFDEIPVCSECGCTTKMREKTKYCPNCGSRNREDE